MEKKKNQIFVYLYALAIIMVIDDHCCTKIGFFSVIFPYDSFLLPLFVFCSGYFWHHSELRETVIRRFKKIMLPYIAFDIVMVLLAYLLDYAFDLKWHRDITLSSVFRMIMEQPTTELNDAAWFAVMMFWISIVYSLIRYKLKANTFNDYLLTGIFTVFGLISVYITMIADNDAAYWDYLRWFVRIAFYIQFYNLGYMFKNYFEKTIEQKKGIVCLVCVILNVIFTVVYGDDLCFLSTFYMSSFNRLVLPLISSITGILFWYTVISPIATGIGERKLVSFIGRNTFTIMQVHLLFINIPNFYCYILNQHDEGIFPDFPLEGFINGPWARYTHHSILLGFFISVVCSLLFAYALERASILVKKKWDMFGGKEFKRANCLLRAKN